MTGGTADFYIVTLRAFLKDGVERTAEIKKCLEKGDLPLYTIHVHTLKSSLKIIGADSLSQTAYALENAGKNADKAYIDANNDIFLMKLQKLLDNINNVLP